MLGRSFIWGAMALRAAQRQSLTAYAAAALMGAGGGLGADPRLDCVEVQFAAGWTEVSELRRVQLRAVFAECNPNGAIAQGMPGAGAHSGESGMVGFRTAGLAPALLLAGGGVTAATVWKRSPQSGPP